MIMEIIHLKRLLGLKDTHYAFWWETLKVKIIVFVYKNN